ncbi:MAG: hypothetical protein M1818_002257 [Claussenomyces sp. TS43310]|nr:MAG: hypothetical protein M1818_002257 [Claussenomyces sp. TS43310]
MGTSEVFSTNTLTEADPAAYKRLHIAPLNPTLLATIIPPSILPSARNISYHSIQTFSEKAYGFVDLPDTEAQKIKKKYQGAILKGVKVKIEEARPLKEIPQDGVDTLPSRTKPERIMACKKRKRNDETLPGVELQDRKIKRGWTDLAAPKHSKKRSKDKKEAVKSKYTAGIECLFRTTLPANVAASSNESSADPKPERRKKGKEGKETIVHEFSKTTKYATFLRSHGESTKASEVTEYVEGKGWVDQDGNVVEAEVKRKRPEVIMTAQQPLKTHTMEESSASEASENISENEASLNVEVFSGGKPQKSAVNDVPAPVDSETSSSGPSSQEEDETTDAISAADSESGTSSSSGDEDQAEPAGPLSTSRPTSSGTQPGLFISIPNLAQPTQITSEVHPLEALFKRRQPDAAETSIAEPTPSFNFFGADTDDLEDEPPVPMTPFTQQDFAHRELRSAAPTPDTAHPWKTFTSWPADRKADNDEGEDDNMDAYPKTPTHKIKFTEDAETGSSEAPVTDFQKWFYENRGETNRAWKKRRKTAAKEKRQKENRKRGEQRV